MLCRRTETLKMNAESILGWCDGLGEAIDYEESTSRMGADFFTP